MRFMPRVEDTFELYKNVLIGMVAVFQIPTLVFVLARMQLVTARFLWRHIKDAILISFIAAAALTPSADPWNQTMFATTGITSRDLKLVFAATVIDQARRRRDRSRGEFPRLWRA